jgi:hypothetical protein
MKHSLSLPLILVILTLPGCGSMGNQIIGPEQGFQNFANGWVGKSIDEAGRRQYACTYAGTKLGLVRVDDLYDEEEFVFACYVQSARTFASCRWALKFERTSRKIVGWRYISNPKECLKDPFYESAW